MIDNHMPRFVNHASCSDYDPDLWFPTERAGKQRSWLRTPQVALAREICSTCPAFQECFDYSLKYSGLYGIWAGLDWYQRQDIQDQAGIKPIEMLSTIPHYSKEGVATDER